MTVQGLTTSISAASARGNWTGKTRGGPLGNWIFAFILRRLGLRMAYCLLVPVTIYFLLAAPKAKKASREFRKRAGISGGWLKRIADDYRHFFTFGQLLLDRYAMTTSAEQFEINFQGEHYMRDALEEGKGLILLSGHIGNWQGAGHILRRLDKPVNIVAFQGEAEHIQKFFAKHLKNIDLSVIASDGSPESSLAILRALSRGEIVAMHGDRCVDSKGVFVDLLGDRISLPIGPYTVAALSGSPLVHVFALRKKTYHYCFRAYPPEHLSFADRKSRMQQLGQWAADFASRLEEQIRKQPFQWGNFYDYWNVQSDTGGNAVK